jgi:hypothetical protein
MKDLIHGLLVLGGIPLLIYPSVLLASLMSLAGHRSGNEPVSLMIVVYSFLLGSLAYPVVYIVCVIYALGQAGTRERAALWFAAGPLGYLLLLVGLMVLWGGMERTGRAS